MASNAGRPRLATNTGVTYEMAKWLDKVALPSADMTNEEISQALGYCRPHIVSMWRGGKARVPLEKLPEMAALFKQDLGLMFRLWLEQYIGGKAHLKPIDDLVNRFVSEEELAIVESIRKSAPSGLSPEQASLIDMTIKSKSKAKKALAAVS